MSTASQAPLGTVVSLWRYPVKSMQGEELNASAINERGLLGDRASALMDGASGLVVSAKNPRRWPSMFDFRARYCDSPQIGRPLPPMQITCPDGSQLRSDEDGIDRRLSEAIGRPVRLVTSTAADVSIECSPPQLDEAVPPGDVYQAPLPPGTFFDLAAIHLLTTGTLDRLRALAPESRFEVRRFRPNIVVELSDAAAGFAENDWIGRTIFIGDEVRLSVIMPCPRCIMTTIPQYDLPKDSRILRTAVEHNQGNVGIYAIVTSPGECRRGDTIRLE